MNDSDANDPPANDPPANDQMVDSNGSDRPNVDVIGRVSSQSYVLFEASGYLFFKICVYFQIYLNHVLLHVVVGVNTSDSLEPGNDDGKPSSEVQNPSITEPLGNSTNGNSSSSNSTHRYLS